MTATPKIFFAVLGVVMLASTTRSEEKAPVRPIDTLSSMEALDNARRLETEDVISIRILENKREGLQQVIAVTGEIQAPYIGLFKAYSLTCRELAYKIKSKLENGFFKEATVIVTLDARGSFSTRIVCPDSVPFVVAFGSLAKQGKFDLASIPNHKLSGLLKLAGGNTSKSSVSKIQIIRKTPQGNKRILVNAKAVLIEKSSEYDLFLRPDDVVIVE